MSTEARIRYQAAKLKVMNEEMQKLVTEITDKEKFVTAAEQRTKQLEDENKKLTRKLAEAEVINCTGICGCVDL